MGHILGSDRILETAAVTAVRHPAMLTTGVLLVVFVSSVKMLSITVSHRRLLFFFFFPRKV